MGFLSKIFKSKIFKVAAPLALNLIPGIGTAAATALGAGIGALGGGGIKGAALGGLGGFAGAGGLSGVLGTAAGSTIPLTTNGIAGGVGQIVSKGSGLLGSLGSAGSALSSIIGSGSGGGIGAGSLLNAGANILSGVQGNQAYKDMVKTQSAYNNKALAEQARQYDQTTANMNPFLTSGTAANSRLSALLGLNGDPASQQAALESSPGYQFRLKQGTQAMNRSLGAQGKLFSGAALKAAQEFGQGLADQTYNDEYERLMNASASGQNAAANLGGIGANYANQASNLYNNQGDINAAGIVARNNNTNQSLANILGSNVGGFSGGLDGYYVDENGNLKKRPGAFNA